MKLGEISNILNATIIVGTNKMDMEIYSICGADLMSDVLAYTKEKTLLLTGLCNTQTIRTAEVSDLCAIIFVRGKTPALDVINLAIESDIPILITKYPMYEACGKLYSLGIPGCLRKEE